MFVMVCWEGSLPSLPLVRLSRLGRASSVGLAPRGCSSDSTDSQVIFLLKASFRLLVLFMLYALDAGLNTRAMVVVRLPVETLNGMLLL